MLSKRSKAPSNILFFWMAMLNNSNEVQHLLDRTFELIKENYEQQMLEYITMMIKRKQNQELLEHLISEDHIEYVAFLCFIYSSMLI